MEDSRVNSFIMAHSKDFRPSALPMVKSQLEQLDDGAYITVESAGYKSPTTALILSIFLGELGIDRFYLGKIGTGVAKLLLTFFFGLGLIWWFVDLFLIMNATRDYNYQQFTAAAAMAPKTRVIN